MDSDFKLEELARENGAWFDNTHVVLPTWDHSSGYFSHRTLLFSPDLQTVFAAALAQRLLEFEKRSKVQIQTIVGPLTEGGLWGSLVRNQLIRIDPARSVRFAVTHQRGSKQTFRDDGDLVAGKKVAIINEVLSTGVSIGPLTAAVIERGGTPVVILSLCDRRVVEKYPIDIEVVSLLRAGWPVWKPSECPLCPDTPINPTLGYGNRYLELLRLKGDVSYLSLGER